MSSTPSPSAGFVRRLIRRPLWVAASTGVVVAGVIVLAAGQRASSPPSDVVLDTPGEYQQPGINTNAPLRGTLLAHGDVLQLDGTTVSTAEWFSTEGRPTVVNFWFTTCPPCRREMPVLQRAFENHGSDIRFIGVNVQDSASAIQTFTDDLGVTYEMVRDPNGSLVVPNGIAAFPTTLFIDSSGRIVKQVAGELTDESIDKAIAELLDTPTP